MKRVLSLVLALSMVMSMFTFSFAGTSLKDITGTEYESAVEALVELGIVNGYNDGTYLPENVVSRAEMAKLLVVAAGLAPAAELAEGTTKFSDVAATHWATGYINVAAEYGYVMGDPAGTFRPDDTVSYAEAITMALRVLGYKTVIEAKGTWPTNYIAKAEELDLLEDITYGSYAAGAKRGNVALLIWNMLRENMWDVKEESEGDGLTYGDIGKSMLNTKFKDYRYFTTIFSGARIVDEGVVEVDLEYGDWTNLEYAKNDFYEYVPGSEVEVLVNIKNDTLLSMVETDEYKYLAGGKTTIDEEYEDNEFIDDIYAYAYAMIDGKEIVDMTELNVKSEYVYELDDSSTKRLKYNGTETLNYETFEDRVVLKDGERASVKDLEVGDVWSTITVTYTDGTTGFTFYMISGAEAEGKLTKLVYEVFEDSNKTEYPVATIGGEEYPVAAGSVYFEDAEDVEDGEEADFLTATRNFKDMKNEEVKFVTDFLGRVVAVMFDGELNGGDESETANESMFYAYMSNVNRTDDVYSIKAATEDGETTLTYAADKGNTDWMRERKLKGYFAITTLNEDGEVEVVGEDYVGTGFALRADRSGDVKKVFDGMELVYNEDGDKYLVSGEESVTFDDDKLLVAGKEWTKVDDDTVVVVLVFDDKGTEKTSDDEYRVEFKDIEAIEKMKNDPVVVITDKGASKFARAKYVVIFEEVSSREDDLVGIVKEVTENRLGDTMITVVEDRDDEAKDGKEYILKADTKEGGVQFIIYSIEENKDGEWELTVIDELSNDELVSGETKHAYIAEADEDEDPNVLFTDKVREAYITIEGQTKLFDLKSEEVTDALEDARIYVLNVVLDEDESETQYFVDNYTEVAYDEVELKELDRLSFVGAEFDNEGNITDADFVLIIRGMEAR